MTALPYLDLADPTFSTRSPAVAAARAESWCARTPYGLAVLRWREAGALLRDRRLRQGSHGWPAKVGLEGPFAEFWMRSVIAKEGRDHRSLRDVIVPALSPDFVAAKTPTFEAIAEDLCDAMEAAGPCEFQETFAAPFAGRAVAAILGLTGDGWAEMAADAQSLGLAMGVDAPRWRDRIDAAYLRLDALGRRLIADARAGRGEDGLVARMTRRFDDAGGAPDLALRDLAVMAVFGGVDTTASQLGLALALFFERPDQWRAMREDPALADRAVEEAIAARPTTTWVTREAVEDFEFEGVDVKAGETIHVLVHATGRDPAANEGPAFDLFAPRKKHFGFGGGAHHCVGHLVARADIAAAFRALARRFERIEPDGPAEFRPDSGNTGAWWLPVRPIRA
ncbi:MAG: cytochrome P450 [Pseudomonadota bacterium]